MNVRSLFLASAIAAVATVAACTDQPTSPAPDRLAERGVAGKRDKDRAALLTNIPVSGVLSDGGTFTGTFTAQRFALDQATRTLRITGLLTGTAVSASGTATAISQVVTAPATLVRGASMATNEAGGMMHTVARRATCDILFLDLGPLNLDLLGLTLDLSQITLDLNAVSGTGNLLGNLLCAVVGLLDLPGFIAGLTQLIDSINNLLAGLNAIGVSQPTFVAPPGDIGFQVMS